MIVQHLDPRHRSLMADIISRRTPLRVKQAEDGDCLAAGGAVYIAPPDRHLLVNADGTLSLTQTELVSFVRPSANLLFESVAASHKEQAIAVVLTGTGSDGAMGGAGDQGARRHGHRPGRGDLGVLRHARGGHPHGQRRLRAASVRYRRDLYDTGKGRWGLMADEDAHQQFEALLQYLRSRRGFDFTGYKRPSLVRRVGRRLQALEPIRQGVRRHFGSFGRGVASGLKLRHDHGSQYMSRDFQAEVAFLGIASSPAFVRAPEGNGMAERFIRTLKEQLLWVRTFRTVEEVRVALHEWLELYNEQWLIERHGHRPPAQVRRDLLAISRAA